MSLACNKRLSLIFTLLLLTLIGCGKKAENSVPDSMGRYATSPALTTSSVTLEMSLYQENVLESDVYGFTQNAWVILPKAEHIRVKSGDPEHYRTRIYFNQTKDETYDANVQMHCEYTVTKLRTQSHGDVSSSYRSTFNGCYEDVDNDGTDELLNYAPGDQIVQAAGKNVIFSFEYGFAEEEAEVYTVLEIADWF